MSCFAKNMWLDDVWWGCFSAVLVFFSSESTTMAEQCSWNWAYGAGDWGMDTSIMIAWLQADWGWFGMFGQFWGDMFG